MIEIKAKILKDLSESDHYSDCGYDSWKAFLSDGNLDIDKEEYDEFLYEEFTEKELEEAWQEMKLKGDFKK